MSRTILREWWSLLPIAEPERSRAMRLFGLLLVAGVVAVVLAAGCVQVKEPLVKFDASGFSDGGSRPDTRVKSTDSEEVKALKQRVAKLERQLADAREKADREKARRKAAEKRTDRLEDQIDDLSDQIKDLRKR